MRNSNAVLGALVAGRKMSKEDREHVAALAEAARERSRERQRARMEAIEKTNRDFEKEGEYLAKKMRDADAAIESNFRALMSGLAAVMEARMHRNEMAKKYERLRPGRHGLTMPELPAPLIPPDVLEALLHAGNLQARHDARHG